MLTMRKSPDMPDFCDISPREDNPFKPRFALSQAGTIVNNEIHNLPATCPSVRVFDSVIMPDHIHIVVYLTENELRDKAIANGCSIILMHGNGFSDRYAPPQPYFDLCTQGRCLIIGEETYRTSTSSDIREHNRAMNALAARIAAGNAIMTKPH